MGVFWKKNRKKIISVLIVLAMALALWGAGRQREQQTVYTKSLFAMNTYFSLKAYGPRAEDALEAAKEKAQELEALFSVTAEDSDIRRLNQASQARVSEDTLSVIETALRLGDETDGALDITIYPVLREWGFTTDAFQIPEAERIAKLLEKVDYRQVEVLRETEENLLPENTSEREAENADERAPENASERATGGIIRVPEGVELDLGAVAKGYTGDCLARFLREAGVTSAILDLGGNIQTVGHKPDGSPWLVAVKNPYDPGEELGVLQVTGTKAVVTSGSYERYFVGEDGKKYGHILNPADGYPAESGLASVTVVGESGAVCDGLSTALFVMGQDAAIRYWREKQDFDMILATDEGDLYITEGLADRFQGGEGWNKKIVTAEN